MAAKRTADEDISLMAGYLMLLSRQEDNSGRVFTCKTCDREFSSFQALGGHRASHKKARLTAEQPPSPPKPKTHECSVCGLEFALGQALGGHMRRHREGVVDGKSIQLPLALRVGTAEAPPMVKKVNGRRVLCMDLNLTPSENLFLSCGKVVE